ncbi:MAG TPA: integrase domain-containing protein [Ramlibacter sp.]|jgi:integrase|nr:integrase domain-containing protein [Ramlibacter sp.]
MQVLAVARSAVADSARAQVSAARGQGSHRALFEQACDRHRGNPQAQFSAYLAEAVLPAATGRRRHVSDKTRTDYGDTLKAVPRLLRRLRRPLQNASEFGRSHVVALVRHWEQQGHAEATVQWRVSLLRRFFTLIGKPEVLPAGAAWHAILQAQGITTGTRRRCQVAIEPKGWSDRGIDAPALLDAIRLHHPVVASQLDLSLWFGLRKNEALQIRPREADRGGQLLVIAGTKGGKPRAVDFSADAAIARQQRHVLDRAKQCAADHPRGILALPGLTLKQSRDHVNYVLRKFGITRKGLGVTQHGLRHQFGCDFYAQVSGLPAPVLAAAPAAAYRRDPDALLAARRLLSRQLGHERTSITAAYTGSVTHLQRAAQARVRDWRDAISSEGAQWKERGVRQAWVGALSPVLGEPVHLFLRMAHGACDQPALLEEITRLAARLAAATGCCVIPLRVQTTEEAPEHAVQLLP